MYYLIKIYTACLLPAATAALLLLFRGSLGLGLAASAIGDGLDKGLAVRRRRVRGRHSILILQATIFLFVLAVLQCQLLLPLLLAQLHRHRLPRARVVEVRDVGVNYSRTPFFGFFFFWFFFSLRLAALRQRRRLLGLLSRGDLAGYLIAGIVLVRGGRQRGRVLARALRRALVALFGRDERGHF